MNPVREQSSSSGFTLVEVLVAVLVLSIGLLGLAALQMTGLKNNQGAHLRSIAAIQLQAMADRMRANPEAVTSGAYHNPTATETSACTTTAGCSATAMAKHDFWEWNQRNAALLPAGQGFVCIDSDPTDNDTGATPPCDNTGNRYVATIRWAERTRQGPETRTMTLSIRP